MAPSELGPSELASSEWAPSELGLEDLSQEVSCLGNHFSESVDVSTVTVDPVLITVRQEGSVDRATVENRSVLAFDLPLVALTESNKGAYFVGGHCDSSVGSVELAIEGMNSDVPCVSGRFLGLIDASHVRVDPVELILIQGPLRLEATLSNEILLGVSFDPPLDLLQEGNKTAYLVSGVCDTSESDVVVLTIGEGVSQYLSCSGNSFSEVINMSAVTFDPLTLRVVQGESSNIAIIGNEILVGVSLSASLPKITELNKTAYLVSGVCDSSESSTLELRIGGLSESLSCLGNSFSEVIDVSGVTVDPATLTVSQVGNSDTVTVANEAFINVDFSSLPVITDANKGSYLVSGVCDSSESGVVRVIVREVGVLPMINQDVTCSGNRFSDSFDLGAIVSNLLTIEVVQGEHRAVVTVVSRAVVGLSLSGSLPAITELNKLAYPLSGTCGLDSGVVTVTAGEDSASPVLSQDVTCSGNRFSELLDLSGVTADPVTIRVVQGTNSDTVTVANEILVGVVLASSLPTIIDDTNKRSYLVSGVCDSSESVVVTLTVGEDSVAPVINQDLTCSGNRFSELLDFDLSGVTADPVTIRVVQGTNFDTATVANEILVGCGFRSRGSSR